MRVQILFEQLSLWSQFEDAESFSCPKKKGKKTEHFKLPEGAAQPLFRAKYGPVVTMSIVRSHKCISTGIQGHKHTHTDANTLCCCTTHIKTHIQAHTHCLTHSDLMRKKIGASVFSTMSSLSSASAACNVDCKF